MRDTDGGKILGGPLWNTATTSLISFFSGFALDLAPYTKAITSFLPAVLPDRSAAQMQDIIDSLSFSDIRVSQDSLAVSINFAVESLPEPAVPAAALSPDELQQFEEQWHMMDALLVGAVKHYAAATELQSLRNALLDILLDSRYQLRDALTAPESGANDALRSWFVESWHQLGPVVRQIALEQDGQEHLMWFKVLAATDALYALDKLGSSIGVQISAEGLRRLARMINAGDIEEMLRYSEDVDPELQKLLRQQIETTQPKLSAVRFNFSLVSRAYAVSPADEVNRLVAGKDNLDTYLPKVASLLQASAERMTRERKLASDYTKLFENLVLATAWQESCWRQYVIENKRIVPLISASGDIGLMQVNERVWRGFYDMNKLRWDITYNSRTGTEILFNYMVQYALKRKEQTRPGGINNLARASYSAYNGGPGQVTRYRRTDVASVHRKVDQLFWDKYQQVDAGKKMNVAKCLGEELSGPA
jgi:soluble lytic murein transglycosylase-like protein